ncbi:esterase/lipase family protein [Streptomyces sedi]|uniref:Alpha/beta fold hydrolase n=1 Tax=Streptomyces sedi TaxID=555059 RepID=A0A5C4USJ8_9ACTN|nr:alpha/beta fold hydrolase [Streptomyces sedi]TNM26333.1 alpha/beta fold hydrolase [Streptomyces sedi]
MPFGTTTPSRANRFALFAGLLALPLLALPGGTANAAAPTGGWNESDCSSEHRPVVLVHGTGANGTVNWLGLAPYLVDRGYCVYSLDYGQLPGVPVLAALGPIEESSAQLADYVDEVLATTGADEVDLVGHSQGGMMPRHYLKNHPGAADKVNALVALAPSTNGTTLSGLTTLLDIVPGLADAIDTFTPALTQQVVGSDFLTELNADGHTVPGVEYTVIATRYDQVVTPYETQFIDEPGVRNVLLQDLCPLNVSEHVSIGLGDRMAFHEVVNALDPAGAEPTDCRHLVS